MTPLTTTNRPFPHTILLVLVAFITFYASFSSSSSSSSSSFAQAIGAIADVGNVDNDATSYSEERTKVPLEAHIMYVFSGYFGG